MTAEEKRAMGLISVKRWLIDLKGRIQGLRRAEKVAPASKAKTQQVAHSARKKKERDGAA